MNMTSQTEDLAVPSNTPKVSASKSSHGVVAETSLSGNSSLISDPTMMPDQQSVSASSNMDDSFLLKKKGINTQHSISTNSKSAIHHNPGKRPFHISIDEDNTDTLPTNSPITSPRNPSPTNITSYHDHAQHQPLKKQKDSSNIILLRSHKSNSPLYGSALSMLASTAVTSDQGQIILSDDMSSPNATPPGPLGNSSGNHNNTTPHLSSSSHHHSSHHTLPPLTSTVPSSSNGSTPIIKSSQPSNLLGLLDSSESSSNDSNNNIIVNSGFITKSSPRVEKPSSSSSSSINVNNNYQQQQQDDNNNENISISKSKFIEIEKELNSLKKQVQQQQQFVHSPVPLLNLNQAHTTASSSSSSVPHTPTTSSQVLPLSPSTSNQIKDLVNKELMRVNGALIDQIRTTTLKLEEFTKYFGEFKNAVDSHLLMQEERYRQIYAKMLDYDRSFSYIHHHQQQQQQQHQQQQQQQQAVHQQHQQQQQAVVVQQQQQQQQQQHHNHHHPGSTVPQGGKSPSVPEPYPYHQTKMAGGYPDQHHPHAYYEPVLTPRGGASNKDGSLSPHALSPHAISPQLGPVGRQGPPLTPQGPPDKKTLLQLKLQQKIDGSSQQPGPNSSRQPPIPSHPYVNYDSHDTPRGGSGGGGYYYHPAQGHPSYFSQQ